MIYNHITLQVTAQYTEDLIRCRSGSKVLEEVVRTFFPITVLDSVARIFVGLPVELQEGGDEMTFEDDDEEEEEEEEVFYVVFKEKLSSLSYSSKIALLTNI
jgi:hypothetical protein